MDTLLDQLAGWKSFRALVVGDFMLDQLVYGDAERLSPDAPVPILNVRRREDRPGGAANVCMDLVALGGSVRAFGVTGADDHAAVLRAALDRERVDASGLVEDAARPTTVKHNLIGLAQTRHPQKMFRVDYESREPLAGAVLDRIIAAFEAALADADVVCIEDYAKGVCTEALCGRVIDACRRAGKPVLVDPARLESYARYRGATVLTPNRTEAETATGLKTDATGDVARNGAVAARVLEAADLDAVVLTLDKHGALLMERGGEPTAVPTIAREVYDVTGAGDMFLAGLAAARANGIDWRDAVRFANAAAGLEVEVFGVEPIPFERVHHAIMRQHAPTKVRTLPQLLVELEAVRRPVGSGRPGRVVFTNGCFDILHAGHISLLERAASEGDFLVVGLNSDASVRRLKGPERPIHTQADRARVLGALSAVDAVVIFEDDTPIRVIEAVRPDALVKGGDYALHQVVGAEVVLSYGGRVVLADVIPGRSTTGAVDRIRGVAADAVR